MLLGTELGLVDYDSRVFLLFTALLWWLSGMYAKAYLAQNQERSRFLIYFLLAMTGNVGLILAQDLTSFYLFFTLMSFASYGLVVHDRSSEAFYAGQGIYGTGGYRRGRTFRCPAAGNHSYRSNRI